MTAFNRRDLVKATALLALGSSAPAPLAAFAKKPLTPALWQKLPTEAYRGKQDDISFIDENTGWYGNGLGRLFRTTDGGKSWSKIWDQPGTFIRALGFVDANNGYLGNVGVGAYPNVKDTHPLYRTRDGGASWEKVKVEGIDKVPGICAIDIRHRPAIYQGELKDQVIIHAAGRVGGPAYLLRSLNNGESWTLQDLSHVAGAIFDVKFFNEHIGFLCAATSADVADSHALILRTMDGGVTWTPVYKSTRPFETAWKMSFPTAKTGFATIQSYDPDPAVVDRFIITTNDGGKSWRELPLSKDKAVREFGIGFVDAKRGWVGTTTGGFETRDGGKNWQAIEFGKAVNKVRIIPKNGGGKAVFAIGTDVHRLDL